jgi:hypothetical protein
VAALDASASIQLARRRGISQGGSAPGTAAMDTRLTRGGADAARVDLVGVGQLTQGQTKNGTIRIATMFATLIIGLIAGPAVSL